MKQFGVFGLGDFGLSVAITLSKQHCQVLAIDDREEKIAAVSPFVTMAVKADINDVDTIKSFDIGKLECVIVCCGDEIGPNVLGIMIAKECGVPKIIVKAKDERTATVYKSIGATEVVFPEKQMGERVGKRLSNSRVLDTMELEDGAAMTEMYVPEKWIGKTLLNLNIRNKYHVNVIGFRTNDKLEIDFSPKRIFKNNDIILVIGKEVDIRKLS